MMNAPKRFAWVLAGILLVAFATTVYAATSVTEKTTPDLLSMNGHNSAEHLAHHKQMHGDDGVNDAASMNAHMASPDHQTMHQQMHAAAQDSNADHATMHQQMHTQSGTKHQDCSMST